MVGASPEQVLEALPAAVRAELEWLVSRGEELPQHGEPVDIWEVERIDLASDVSRGRWVGAFKYERRPTTNEDVALMLARSGLVRTASRGLLETLGTHASADAGAFLSERAGEIVNLLSRLGTRPAEALPGEPREAWEAAWRTAEERLRNLLPGDRERHAVFDGEEWTTRKVLRTLAVGERVLHARLAEQAGVSAPLSFGGSPSQRHSPR